MYCAIVVRGASLQNISIERASRSAFVSGEAQRTSKAKVPRRNGKHDDFCDRDFIADLSRSAKRGTVSSMENEIYPASTKSPSCVHCYGLQVTCSAAFFTTHLHERVREREVHARALSFLTAEWQNCT